MCKQNKPVKKELFFFFAVFLYFFSPGLLLSQIVDNSSVVGGVLQIPPNMPDKVEQLTLTLSENQPWHAQWIWQEADGPTNTWICFRKSFVIDQLPAVAIARIAVDSKYWLWINGQMVVLEGGLKRGPNPHDTYYEQIDIASFLLEGENLIAAQVWYFGKSGFSHNDSGKGGFLFESAFEDKTILSDSSWKIYVDTAYLKSSGAFSQTNVRLPESHVFYDSEKDFKGQWNKIDYDDSNWLNAVQKGIPPVAPWNSLWLRPIPQWKNYGLKNFDKIYLRNNNPLEYIEITLPYTTVRSSEITAELPYNAQVNPYIEIQISDPKTISFHGDSYHKLKDKSVAGTVRAKPGLSSYESPGWMNGHNIVFNFPVGVTIKSLKYRETGYDVDFAGSFVSNDEYFNKLWNKAQRTLYIAMRDNFMDCPDRERALWWGDAVIHIGKAFYALDRKSDMLAKKSIDNLIDWQRDDHVLYAPVPSGNWHDELPAQMLASVGEFGFWNYFMHTGDTATIIKAYPHVKDYLNVWILAANGLLEYRPGGWDWSDWGGNIDSESLQNAWYYLALNAAKKMAVLTDNAIDTVIYNSRMINLKNSFNELFWDGSAYRSPSHIGIVDDRVNAMAVLAGIADKSKWENIRDILNSQRHASPYMEKYILEALYVMGYENDALARMKHPDRYKPMVDDPGTTLFEFFGNGGSNNHAWSGGPLTLLSQYAAGVAPITPAYGTYQVFPQEGELTYVKTVTPSVKGNIEVEINKISNNYNLKLTSPENTKALVGIPIKQSTNKRLASVSVNNSIAWLNNDFVGIDSQIRMVEITDRYLVFEVDPGVYVFEGVYENQIITEITRADNDVILSCRLTPNPASDYLQISFNHTNIHPTQINLYSIHGRLLSTQITDGMDAIIDLKGLNSGVYILKMFNGQYNGVEIFVKQ